MLPFPYTLEMFTFIGPRLEFFRPEEIHHFYVIIGVEKGSFKFSVGEDSGTATFGDLVFVPPGVLFKRKSLGEITFHMLVFQPTEKSEPIFDSLPVGKVTISDVNRLNSTYSYLRQCWHELGSKSVTTSLASHMLMDLLHLSHLEQSRRKLRKARTDHQMQMAARLVHEQFAGEMSMKEIADQLGIKPSELTRRFRLEYGVIPMEYATRLRIEKAKKLLLETDHTLEMIASLCGYENGSYLGRVFRAKVGMNASEFRRNNQI